MTQPLKTSRISSPVILKTKSDFYLSNTACRHYWSSEQICLELKVWVSSFLNIRSSRLEVASTKVVLKNFAKFIEKYPCCSLHFKISIYTLRSQAQKTVMWLLPYGKSSSKEGCGVFSNYGRWQKWWCSICKGSLTYKYASLEIIPSKFKMTGVKCLVENGAQVWRNIAVFCKNSKELCF